MLKKEAFKVQIFENYLLKVKITANIFIIKIFIKFKDIFRFI